MEDGNHVAIKYKYFSTDQKWLPENESLEVFKLDCHGRQTIPKGDIYVFDFETIYIINRKFWLSDYIELLILSFENVYHINDTLKFLDICYLK